MKKNLMARIASGLMVAVLLTTCVISGTFAKYVSEAKAGDEARVAKWGIVVRAGGRLFSENYFDVANGNSATTSTSNISVHSAHHMNAAASVNDKLVAPGTKGDGHNFSFSISGEPEVAFKIDSTIKAQNIFIAPGTYGVMAPVAANDVDGQPAFSKLSAQVGLYKKDNNNFVLATSWEPATTYYTFEEECNVTSKYYPVIFNYGEIGSSSNIVAGSHSSNSIDLIAAKIAEQMNGSAVTGTTGTDGVTTYTISSNTYAANAQALQTIDLGNKEIKWEWAFETGTTVDEKKNNDYIDTILGDLVAEKIAHTDSFNGSFVVKKVSDQENTYTAPVENTDYSLNVVFDIDCKITQVD